MQLSFKLFGRVFQINVPAYGKALSINWQFNERYTELPVHSRMKMALSFDASDIALLNIFMQGIEGTCRETSRVWNWPNLELSANADGGEWMASVLTRISNLWENASGNVQYSLKFICPYLGCSHQKRSCYNNRFDLSQRKYDHITPVMWDELHWLPSHSTEYKVCQFIFKCLQQILKGCATHLVTLTAIVISDLPPMAT